MCMYLILYIYIYHISYLISNECSYECNFCRDPLARGLDDRFHEVVWDHPQVDLWQVYGRFPTCEVK